MSASEISNLLNEFSPISLEEMDCVELMNRTDTKYIFSSHKLPLILERAANIYRILEIKHKRIFSYSTTYLDTANYMFFNQQMSGKLNRHKVRYRIYEASGTSYLEVKRKTNKNRTIKWRIQNRITNEGCDNHAKQFVQNLIELKNFNLKPILINRFDRLTLVNFDPLERVTIDHNLSFSDGNGKTVHLPFLGIVELKREGYTNNSPFINMLKDMEIRSSGFSKYCIGGAMLYDLPRKNMLKPKFLKLNKIENEYDKFNHAY